MENNKYYCPVCKSNDLVFRHEASYIYSYIVDSDAPGRLNSEEFLSYQYDKREQTESCKYVECNSCGTKYPYGLLNGALDKESHDMISDYCI